MFIACGLNHKTTPLAIREQFAIPVEQQSTFLQGIVNTPNIEEAAILSTCNRTEIYCETSSPQQIITWLAHTQHCSPEQLSPYLYTHTEHHGIRHVLRVASGLDSMLVGEPQILGQIKQAYQQANQLGTIHQQLTPIFQFIFSASKRIRHHSGISKNPISVASTAAQLIIKKQSDPIKTRVLIIGTGETSTLVAKYLHQEGIRQFIIATRTPNIYPPALQQLAATTIAISDIPLYLHQVDVVISATACPIHFINKSWIAQALAHKKPREAGLLLVDLAVPRDIDPNVQELSDVQLFNIDDLHHLIDQSKTARCRAATHAEQLIEIEIDQYLRTQRRRHAKNIICTYRNQMNHVAQKELKRAQQKLDQGHCQSLVLQEFSTRLVNKLAHIPTLGLQQLADDNPQALSDMTNYLFTLTASEHE